MRKSKCSLWWRDSNQTASGKPGAVQTYCRQQKPVTQLVTLYLFQLIDNCVSS